MAIEVLINHYSFFSCLSQLLIFFIWHHNLTRLPQQLTYKTGLYIYHKDLTYQCGNRGINKPLLFLQVFVTTTSPLHLAS